MQLEFWQQRWLENLTGFHLNEVNPYLIEHWSELGIEQDAGVFVPLCGKSLDLIWLADHGYQVIGVECSQLAVDQFFEEQGIAFKVTQQQGFKVYQAGALSLLQGDFFELDKQQLENVKAVYDRASLVALPVDMRADYVAKLVELLAPEVRILLVTLSYDQQKMSGPPFSVSEHEVQSLYADYFTIEKLYQRDIIVDEPRFQQKGLDYLIETVFSLRAR